MKRILLIILSFFIFTAQNVFAETDWDSLYNNSKPFETKLMYDIDPFQDEDNLKYSYSPYPLFRTSCHLYYRNMHISPGYYHLTPRKLNGRYFILFKTNGKVKFIIPVVKEEVTPESYYKKFMPKPKLTLGQTIAKNWLNFWHRIFKDSGKQPPPQSYVELTDVTGYFVLKLYFKDYCYYTVYKKSPF